MAKNKTASDFNTGTIQISNDLIIDTKIKLGAIMYLEDKYDCSIQEINFSSTRVKEFVNLVVALAMQHNPELTEQQAMAAVKKVDIDQLQKFSQTIENIFNVEVKNLQRPVKTNVQGNLTEQ